MAEGIEFLRGMHRTTNRRRLWTACCTYALIWLILTGTDLKSWIIGGIAVLSAALCRQQLAAADPTLPNLLRLLPFILFFLRQSFMSGLDVMRRTISPTTMLKPGLITYTTMLQSGTPRILFANTISLLPGTLSVELKNQNLIVHAIDIDMPVWAGLQTLEGRIASVFQNYPDTPKMEQKR